MARWLVKSDPETYSFADLAREGTTSWDGVKNAAALGHLRKMKPGDDVLVYESGAVKAIVGRAKVASKPRSDPKEAKLSVIDLTCVGPLARPLPLAAIKAERDFASWELVRISRLSVMPVPEPVWKRVAELTGRPEKG